jgi:hypothetical protein
VTPKLDLNGAYYAYRQNSFATGAHSGCSDASNSGCSGTLNAESFVSTYKVTSHMQVYGGIMRSAVEAGLAAGYLSTVNVNTMTGVQFTF